MTDPAHDRLPRLLVTGVGVWTPGFPSAPAWIAGEADPEVVRASGRILDRMNRRRASALGRALVDAAAEAMEAGGVDPATVPTVVGSALGEVETMIGLLDQMWRRHEPASPAAFTMSVHNAASGLLSISTKNRGFTTSIAADDDTPAAALFEAIGLAHASGGPVVVTCGDGEVPGAFVAEAERFGLLAVALALAPDDGRTNGCARIVGPSRGGTPHVPTDLPRALATHPQVGLLDLADAVLRGREGRVRLDRGRGAGWCVDVVPLEDG